MDDDRHARISEEAYRLWKAEGEPHGRDREHWEQAERAFAGEGPVADEADPRLGDDAAAAASVTGANVADGTADDTAAVSEPAPDTAAPSAAATSSPAPAATKPAAKKPATRRKRTT